MGVRLGSVSSTTFVGPLPASAAETVILTSPPISLPIDNAQVLLSFFFVMSAGATVTAFTFRLRRGTTNAGALVSAATWNIDTTAGLRYMPSGCYVDSPGIVAGQQYSLTVVQFGASGAGVFQDGCLTALAF